VLWTCGTGYFPSPARQAEISVRLDFKALPGCKN
jgi:hypothetical protein